MDAHVKDIVRETTKASDEERILFPDVVKALIGAGVERYHTDLIRGVRTYFMPDDSHEDTHGYAPAGFATAFSAENVEKALRAIQRGEIRYHAFCDRIAAAGCVGYFVSIAGRRALYYGRTGETYTEHFPQAK